MPARSMLGDNHARDRSGGAGGLNGFAAAADTNTKPGRAPMPWEAYFMGQAAYRPSSPRQLSRER